jgi:hypothetical protein
MELLKIVLIALFSLIALQMYLKAVYGQPARSDDTILQALTAIVQRLDEQKEHHAIQLESLFNIQKVLTIVLKGQ